MRTAVTPIELLMAFDMKLAVMRDELDYMQRKVQAALSQIRGREEIAQLSSDLETTIIPLAEVERRTILAAYSANNQHRVKTAAQLGIGKITLFRKLKEYGL